MRIHTCTHTCTQYQSPLITVFVSVFSCLKPALMLHHTLAHSQKHGHKHSRNKLFIIQPYWSQLITEWFICTDLGMAWKEQHSIKEMRKSYDRKVKRVNVRVSIKRRGKKKCGYRTVRWGHSRLEKVIKVLFISYERGKRKKRNHPLMITRSGQEFLSVRVRLNKKKTLSIHYH